MAALYELAANYRALADALSESELPPEAIADTLDGETGDFDEKVINTAKVIQNMRAEHSAICEAVDEMVARARRIANRANSLEGYLLSNMQLANRQKVNSPWFVVSLTTSKRAIVDDAALIPSDYLREKPAVAAYTEPDKALIKKAITDGFQVPGAHIEQHVAVSIKA